MKSKIKIVSLVFISIVLITLSTLIALLPALLKSRVSSDDVGGYIMFYRDNRSEAETLTWEEVMLQENGNKYGYNSSAITFDEIGDCAFLMCENIGEFSTPTTMRTIGKGAFEYSNIRIVKLNDGIKKIGDVAFYHSRLAEITMPDSIKEIGESAFNDQVAIGMRIPKNVKEISKSSYNLSGLEEIEIPYGVKTIGENAFMNCIRAKTITIPNSVKTIKDNAFRNCNGVSDVEIPDSAKEIHGGAFIECSELKRIIIPAGIKYIANDDCDEFFAVENLKSITYKGNVNKLLSEVEQMLPNINELPDKCVFICNDGDYKKSEIVAMIER